VALRDGVVDKLRESILRGDRAPGDVLAETEIAARLGVSRGPVREALAVLEREGLVVSPPNRRARVVELGLRDIEEIYSMRRSLEQLAAQRAVRNITDGDLSGMRATLRDMAAAFDRRDLVELSLLDVAFHDHIYVASKHRRLQRAWADLRSQVVLFLVHRNTNALTSREVVVGEHGAIVDALANGDADRLTRLIEDHLLGAYERLRDSMIVP
jgi:DNA-binding GntR family transcriptional regulator